MRLMNVKWTAATLALMVAGTACDDSSDPFGPGGDSTASVSGSVEPGSTASAPAPAPAPSPQGTSAEAGATTVVIGELQSNGSLQVLAEAEVDTQGRFQLDSVPAHRNELVIQARSEAGAVVGSVVLHEETAPGGHHRAHPINARSSLHADVWIASRSGGSSGGAMGSAELALFLDASASGSAPHGHSSATVAALAEGSIRAQQVITAVLDSEGIDLNASARNALLLALAAQRDRDRDAGAGAAATKEAYVSGAVSALAGSTAEAEAMVLAWAAAATAWDAVLEGTAEASARTSVVREALLLNLRARKAVAGSIQGDGAAHGQAVVSALADLEAQVGAASSVEAMKTAVGAFGSSVESKVRASVLAQLTGLPGSIIGSIEVALGAAFTGLDLAAGLDTAATATARAQAVAAFRAEVDSAAEAVVEELPAGAGISAEVMARILLAASASPAIG
jgi:hypothetical protein